MVGVGMNSLCRFNSTILYVVGFFEEEGVDETSNKLSYNVSGLKLGVRSTKLSMTCSPNS